MGRLPELGTMAHLLRLCNGRTAQKEYLVGQLRNFIKEVLNCDTLLDKETIELIGLIAKEFRNPGAHSNTFTKDEAEECRQLCMDFFRRLESCSLQYQQSNN